MFDYFSEPSFELILSTRFLLIFIITTLFARLLLVNHFFSVSKPFPPGPRCWPFVGFLPYLDCKFNATLNKLWSKFGPIYQIFLGSNRVVILNDPELIREAFRQPVFSGRPLTELSKLLQGYGIANSNGALWHEQRLFLSKILRQINAKNTYSNDNEIESKINVQIQDFLLDLKTVDSDSFRIRPLISRAISKIIGSLLLSHTFDSEEDTSLRRLIKLFDDGFRLVTIALPSNFVPLFRYVPLVNRTFEKIKENRQETLHYFRKLTNAKRAIGNYRNEIHDICDAFLLQQEKLENQGKESFFTEEQLLQTMIDLFSAALQTVTDSIDWAVILLMTHQDIQRNVQNEIEGVIGRERSPSVDDMYKMPYTQAVIYEILRRGSVVPLGPAHSTLEDAELAGYRIPKDTHVIANIQAVHMDPKLWVEPEKFRPERFLKDGKVFRPNNFIPFSVGRRMCLGDVLARMEIFLFLTNLLQRYNFEAPLKDVTSIFDGTITSSNQPEPYEVCLKLR